MRLSFCLDKVINAMLSMQRRSWEQGVSAQALMESGHDDLVVLLAKDAVINQFKDGRLGLNGDNRPVTDSASNGIPLKFAFEKTGDKNLGIALNNMVEYIQYKSPKSKDGLIFHNAMENMIWVDSMFMLPPFLSYLGMHKEALKQVLGYREKLYDSEKKLLYHIWDEDLKLYKRKLFWGVGIGWAISGMTRVAKFLPENMNKERNLLANYIKELIDTSLTYQREDFLFHDIIDDKKTFVETNFAQMISYSIFECVSMEFLNSSYIKAAENMRKAALCKVDVFGIVNDVCGAPNFDRPGTAVEGQAFFIFMESAYQRLKNM